MAINIRAYSRDSDTSVGNAIIQQHHAPPGALRGLPSSREFGGAIGPLHHPTGQPAGRGNRGNNRSDVSIQVSCTSY